jgi:hypothetical protein
MEPECHLNGVGVEQHLTHVISGQEVAEELAAAAAAVELGRGLLEERIRLEFLKSGSTFCCYIYTLLAK